MKPELFHRWYDPLSTRVVDFIHDNGVEHLVEYIDIDDEDEMASVRLIQLTGSDEVPCLYAEEKAIRDPDEIINWIKSRLLGAEDVRAM